MLELTYTLLAEGSSDQALMPILNWLLQQHLDRYAISPQWADLSILPEVAHGGKEKIRAALINYPCQLLFVHRDADRDARETRADQIRNDFADLTENEKHHPLLCVVPVRMQEAWLLIEEPALFRAAGNPHGRAKLAFPQLRELEAIPDPKQMLHHLLREACVLQGHRRKKFDAIQSARLVTQYIDDFSSLRRLSAFQTLERELESVIQQQGW